MPKHKAITDALALIFQGIDRLGEAFPKMKFTIDGRLVGDIGEVIAALEYDVILHDRLQRGYDGKTSNGRDVQIKATFQDQLTFKTITGYYLGFELHADGDYEEIFNGPAQIIHSHYKKRKGIGVELLRFPNSQLRELSKL